MPIYFQLRKEKFQLEGRLSVKEALEKLGLSPESHIILKNGELVNENEPLANGDKVRLVPVISGGLSDYIDLQEMRPE